MELGTSALEKRMAFFNRYDRKNIANVEDLYRRSDIFVKPGLHFMAKKSSPVCCGEHHFMTTTAARVRFLNHLYMSKYFTNLLPHLFKTVILTQTKKWN